MKKTIFTLLWMIALCIVGLVVFAIFITAIMPLPPHADPTSPDVQHKVMIYGLVSWVFPIGLPILALILGIFGKLPGTHGRKDLVQT
jgi:uncharacterized BrkB/YihY/UPF0761 family membrane protein